MKALLTGVILFASCCMAQETKTNETSTLAREWTAVNGTKIQATFVSKKNGMIALEKQDGKNVVLNALNRNWKNVCS